MIQTYDRLSMDTENTCGKERSINKSVFIPLKKTIKVFCTFFSYWGHNPCIGCPKVICYMFNRINQLAAHAAGEDPSCSGCPIFLEIRNPWGKVMERSGLRFEHFCLEVV